MLVFIEEKKKKKGKLRLFWIISAAYFEGNAFSYEHGRVLTGCSAA
jgi:hypothetical protein